MARVHSTRAQRHFAARNAGPEQPADPMLERGPQQRVRLIGRDCRQWPAGGQVQQSRMRAAHGQRFPSVPVTRAMRSARLNNHVAAGSWVQFEHDIIVGEAETGTSIRLAGVAAEMWQAIVAHGDSRAAAVAAAYGQPVETVRDDFGLFTRTLAGRNLLSVHC